MAAAPLEPFDEMKLTMLKLPFAFTVAAAMAAILLVGCQSRDTVPPPTAAPVTATAPATPAVATATAPPPAAATATPAPTATATPTATPAAGRIRLPTPTPAPPGPTPTIAPSATPIPTPRPESTARNRNICRRTPSVQTAIMRHLNVNLCAVITQDELFRITGPRLFPGGGDLELGNVLHPDDLAGLENLEYLRYRGLLDYLDFTHTPALRWIQLREPVENLPDNFSLTGLPKLERFSGEFRGPAVCRLLEIETLRRVFGNVGDWPDNPDDNTPRIRLKLVLPATEAPVAPGSGNAYDNWRREMTAAISDELGLLDAARAAADAALMGRYGPDPLETFRDIYGDPDTAAAELARYRAEQIRHQLGNRIEINTDVNLPACE